ncbi:hypothetical protein OAQ76_00315 [bacterium]|nr:hypothetical protein [bacterium]
MSEYELLYYNDLKKGNQVAFLASNLAAKSIQHYLRNNASSRYYLEYFGGNFKNRSPILFQNGQPVLMIPALCPENELHFANWPTEMVTILEGDLLHRATRIMISALKNDANQSKRVLARLKHQPAVFKELHGQVQKIEQDTNGLVNCQLSEDTIKSCLRKSYKSLVNWGKKNLELRVVDENQPDRESFLKFKELHINASGRKTRSDLSWLHQFNIIKSGYGFLIAAHYNHDLVSGCFVMHDQKTAVYSVAASNRDLMSDGLPLNHYTLWGAIMNARKKGCETFILGDVNEDNAKDDKAKNIALFKRGFATDISVSTILNICF